jgi:hypothetical protein
MESQHQNESKSSAKAGRKKRQQAQQRHDDHTNSARAGEKLDLPEDTSVDDLDEGGRGQTTGGS